MMLSLSHDQWVSELSSRKIEPRELVQSAFDADCKFIWHPLGFIMCKLSDQGKKKIRLHIWPSNGGKTQEPTWLIHDHIFDLKSWVLTGEIINHEYVPVYSEPTYCVYHALYQGNKSILVRSDTTLNIKKKNEKILGAGQEYLVASGVFHKSISVSNITTVTVCETIDKLKSDPMVVGEINCKPKYIYSRKSVSKGDIERVLNNI